MSEDVYDVALRSQECLESVRSLKGQLKKIQKVELEGFINDQEILISTILDRYRDDEQTGTNRIALLMKAVRSIAEGRNVKNILQAALSGAALLMDANSGAVVFKDEYETDTFPAIKYPPDSDEEYLYSRTVVKKVLETGDGVFEKDISKSKHFVQAGSIIRGGIYSVLAAPIVSFGEILGVVYLDSRESGKDLKETDLPFLCDFAAIASLAYESTALSYRRIQYLEKDIRDTFNIMIGKGKGLKHVDDLITRYAPIEKPVLIIGETGTGKRIIADELHHRSEIPGPFIIVNCAGIPENLFESEFFGHVKGAFTDAIKDRKGVIDLAQDGTLFLDEIGELSMGTQAKLLTFFDDGTYRMLGDNKTHNSNARVIAATNRDLPELIKDKHFREDLFYRLNVLTIELPPLRKRPEDISELCHYFVDRECRVLNKPFMSIHKDVISKLRQLPWKGNVRELKNIIQRLVIHTDKVAITCDALEHVLVPSSQNGDPFAAIEDFTEDEITAILRKRALDQEDGNVAAAARRLGIAPPTLHRWMKKSDSPYEG